LTIDRVDRLEGIEPQLAPISSIMGQIMMLAMWSETDETGPLELRTYGDWVVRQRLLTIPGISQVFTMGGGRKQFQVLVDPEALLTFGVTKTRLAVTWMSKAPTSFWFADWDASKRWRISRSWW